MMPAIIMTSTTKRFFLLLVLVCAVPALTKSVPEENQAVSMRPDDAQLFLQAASIIRNARAVTATLLTTTTISSVTVTTITTKKICGVLASGVTINGITTMTTTPVVTCRRRRMYWDEPVFIALRDDDNLELQFRQLTPSQIFRFEPTTLPEFRRNENSNPGSPQQQIPARKKVASAAAVAPEVVNKAPSVLQPSFEFSFEPNEAGNFRVAQPIYFNALSSIVSTILSNLLTSTSTSTSIITSYTSTSTSTSYTATSSYYVAGACYPSGLTTC